jgi:hypothetical protein
MRRYAGHRSLTFVIAIVLLLVAMPAVPSGAVAEGETAQETGSQNAGGANQALAAVSNQAMVVNPSLCAPARREAAAPVTPGAASIAVAEIDPALWDDSEGLRPDNDAYIGPVEAARVFLACSNAGDSRAARTMVTDTYPREGGAIRASASPVAGPAPEAAWLELIEVSEVREHESGQVVVFLELNDPGYCDRNVHIAFLFRKAGDVWLIESIADVTDHFDPVMYEPPVFRPRGAARCETGV